VYYSLVAPRNVAQNVVNKRQNRNSKSFGKYDKEILLNINFSLNNRI